MVEDRPSYSNIFGKCLKPDVILRTIKEKVGRKKKIVNTFYTLNFHFVTLLSGRLLLFGILNCFPLATGELSQNMARISRY